MADRSTGPNLSQPSLLFFPHVTAAQDGFPIHMNAFINVFPLDLLRLNRKMMNRPETLRPADPQERKKRERVGEERQRELWTEGRGSSDRDGAPLHHL